MENTSDSFMPGPLLFCMKIERSVCYKVTDNKSTVHKDCTDRLKQLNPGLASEVRQVLDVNKQERHIRGGLATREKYLHQH